MKNMKKFIAALLVMMMVVALASTAFAYKEEPVDYKVKFTGSAWGYEKVTNQYGKNKSSIAIRKGSVLWAAGKKGNWYKIWLPGRGDSEPEALWFCGDYLKVDDVKDDWKLVYSAGGSGRSVALEGETKSLAGYKKVTVKSGRRTNIRKTASLAGKSLGVIGKGHSIKTVKLSKNKRACMDSRGVWFYEIIYKGKTAWVSEQYVDLKK